jgi:hypothetical protein
VCRAACRRADPGDGPHGDERINAFLDSALPRRLAALARRNLTDHCRFGQGAFAGASGNDEDAPKAVFPIEPTEPQGSTSRRHSQRISTSPRPLSRD